MRTQEEIAARIDELNPGTSDYFGFERSALLDCLDFEHALPYLKDGITREEFDTMPCATTREQVIATMHKYMAFAWDKAVDHRGLSASRSVDKFRAWLWVLGDDALLAKYNDTQYENYGAPKLAVVCEALGFPGPPCTSAYRMSRGETCGADHECGCGQGVVGGVPGLLKQLGVGANGSDDAG